MKKLPNYLHRFVEFAKGELEVTLAVLIVLAFVIGYTYADTTTELDSGDVEVAQEITTTKLNINGRLCEGLNFASSNIPDLHRVRSGFLRGDIITTSSGTRGATNTATYTYKLSLDQSVSNTFYLWGEYTQVTVNGTSVQGPTEPIHITGSNITITLPGGPDNIISKLVTYPGTGEGTAPQIEKVETLYILPLVASVEVDSTRTFEIIALNSTGNSISSIAPRWHIADGGKFASINSITGILTGNTPGGPVTVEANVNGAIASATVTVQAKRQPLPLVPPTEETQPLTIIPPSTDGGADADTTPTQPTETQEPNTVMDNILDFFAGGKAAQPLEEIDDTSTTPAESSTVIDQPATSFVQKVTSGITAVATTITEFFAGKTSVDDVTGETTHVKSIFQTLGDFFSRLLLDVDTKKGEGGAGAETMGSGVDESDTK